MVRMSTQEMGLEKIKDKFLRMEDKLDLFNKKIDNVIFWESIRVLVFQDISQVTYTSDQSVPQKKNNSVDIVKIGIRSIKNLLTKNPYLSTQKDILFLGHSRRRLLEDGNWWDIYCDPIIENQDKSYLLVEPYYLHKHLTPPKTQSIKYLDIFVFLSFLRRKLGLVRISLTDDEKKLVKRINDEIYSSFNTEYDVENLILKLILTRRNFVPFFKRLLKRVQPKLVILVISYTPLTEALCEASKKMNIPVVELQHGVLNPYHFGYSFPGQQRKKRSFVDYFFAFGNFWRDSIEFPVEKERIFSVGYPYLEKELAKYKNVPKKDQILFISPGYPLSKALTKFAVEFSEKTHQNNTIIYKLHPGEYHQWKNNYPWLVNSNIHVIDKEDISLHQLFAESKIQIGISSTAIYEGLSFRLKTYIVKMLGVEYMDFLIENGAAKLISSVDELEEAIAKDKDFQTVNPDFFFKKDALSNIYEKIDELINFHADD